MPASVLHNTPNARVTGVTATGSGIGIFVANTTGALLSGNTVTNNVSRDYPQQDHGRPARRQHGHEQRGRTGYTFTSTRTATALWATR